MSLQAPRVPEKEYKLQKRNKQLSSELLGYNKNGEVTKPNTS
jgi:hypothetical protein